MSLLMQACKYRRSGAAVIPCAPNKRPLLRWKKYQQTRPSELEVCRWFWSRTVRSLAIITGAVSGGLEVLDFDHPPLFRPWYQQVCAAGLHFLPVVQTPSGGYHVYYHTQSVAGNQKLAMAPMPSATRKKYQTLIETRGEGGYVLAPPSPGYQLKKQSLLHIPSINAEQREFLLAAARDFDQRSAAELQRERRAPRSSRPINPAAQRPGDRYNQAGNVGALLQKHRWQLVRSSGEETHWRRPGKSRGTASATFNYAGNNLFYVFSTNAYPFQSQRSYSRFAVYTILEHHGDFAAAARKIRAVGVAATA